VSAWHVLGAAGASVECARILVERVSSAGTSFQRFRNFVELRLVLSAGACHTPNCTSAHECHQSVSAADSDISGAPQHVRAALLWCCNASGLGARLFLFEGKSWDARCA